ncbi:integrase domain-containing protein [Grimontia kaedaensis]|uniref:Integrase domain-containing protein n=1 Tax=Grimontia kaedaensis TaxID=2872157 RepID=A0ABY4WSI5_9GAMM|nr:phage integrase N-terminal domain-containing protein [Grimontia kaedaensis]USH02112.1 integrase domain-containing protein [Grimontia kaedaensis]
MATNFMCQANQVLRRNRDGSHATQAERKKVIQLIDKELRELGVKKLELRNLKRKHIDKLLKHWNESGKAAGTIKNRMSHIRWLAEKIGKSGLVPASNTSLGIAKRQYVTNKSKARHLSETQLKAIGDPHLEAALRMQKAFGLRREEAMKIILRDADRGTHLHIVKTKGARPRDIPIRTEEQRSLIDEVKNLVGAGSLIPPELKYVQQLRRFEKACIEIGLDRSHGLRHAYAQQRYLELTGRCAPAAGGKSSKELTREEKLKDRESRLIISEELGHSREDVTAVYLGR